MEFGHYNAANAITDFTDRLPGGTNDYILEIREFTTRLYQKAALNNERYFLDKTPRYHLIADEIIQMFPDAKFIFLWRNPLAVISSIMETWAAGKWNLYRFQVDLFQGCENLVSACERYQERCLSLRYEDLLSNPNKEIQRIFDHLEIPTPRNVADNFKNVNLDGRMGDPTGAEKYGSTSHEPLEKWKLTLSNSFRKSWCRRYLNWIGRERLALMGYDLEKLLADLNSTPTGIRYIGSDIMRTIYGFGYRMLEFRILKSKMQLLSNWKKIQAHT